MTRHVDILQLKKQLNYTRNKHSVPGRKLGTGETDVGAMCADVLEGIEYLEDAARRWKSLCPRWVPVEERMPGELDLDRNGCVLCLDVTDTRFVCVPPDTPDGAWETPDGKLVPVTHWVSTNAFGKDMQEEYRKAVVNDEFTDKLAFSVEALVESVEVLRGMAYELKEDMAEIKGGISVMRKEINEKE